MKKPPRFTRWILGLATFVSWWAGCASSHQVKVDALAKPAAENSIAYRIVTSNPDIDPESLRHKETERLVKTALSGKGLYEAPRAEMADMVVSIDYGVGPPKVSQETHREPTYRTVPGATHSDKIVVAYTLNGTPIYQTITWTDPPRQEHLGDREYVVTHVSYEKYLRLSARSNTPPVEGRPVEDVWTVDVITEGESRDLRKALPVLAAASIEYVGKDSHGQQTIRLKDTDSAIAFVKKGL